MNLYNRRFIKEFPDKINRAAYSYFHPIKEIKSLKNGNYEFIYDYNKIKQHELSKSLAVISNAVCFNQSSLIQYTYLAAEKHKNIKDYFNNEKNISKDVLGNLVDELLIFLNKKLFEVSHRNFEYMKLFFEGRSLESPRICLKGNFQIDQKRSIVSVFRDHAVSYHSDCEIEKNSGFDYILKKGRYYINNDIPKSFFKGEYRNPRLSYTNFKNQASDSKMTMLLINKFPSMSDQIIDWRKCWIDFDNDNYKEFYKSTLIIPMTLVNNELTKEFKDKVSIDDVEKVIFGFLCLDHVDKDYFNENIDVSIGYIFADMLSIYLFNRLVYTEISKTFQKIDETLNSGYVERIINKLNTIQKMWSIASLDISDICLNIKESTSNQLYYIDDILAKRTTHKEKIIRTEQPAQPDREKLGSADAKK